MISNNNFFEYFAGSGFVLTVGVIILVCLFVFVFLLMYIPALTKKIFPKFGYNKYSNYLPFKTVYDDDTMSIANGSIIRVFRISGIQTSMQEMRPE